MNLPRLNVHHVCARYPQNARRITDRWSLRLNVCTFSAVRQVSDALRLGGMVNVQTVFYFRWYEKDPLRIKSLVSLLYESHILHVDRQGSSRFSLFGRDSRLTVALEQLANFCRSFLDNLHTAFIWGGLWYSLVLNYGVLDRVDFIPWYATLSKSLTS